MPSLTNQNLNLSLLFKQNLKIHNFSNIHRHIRVPVRKQGCSSWDQTGFLTTRRSGADTWLTWCLDFSSLLTVFLRVRTDSPICFSELGEHFTFCLSQLFSNCRTCFPWAAVMYFVSCFSHLAFLCRTCTNVLYFRLYFVSWLFLFSVFAAVAVFRKTFSS